MCEAEDWSRLHGFLGQLSETYSSATGHQVTFRASEASETVYCEFDGNNVCSQSIALDSYGAAVRDASRCIPMMLEAFRDTYA